MSVARKIRFEVLKRDGFRCAYCHRNWMPLDVDHVIPVARGGSDDLANLVACCEDCNQGKKATPLEHRERSACELGGHVSGADLDSAVMDARISVLGSAWDVRLGLSQQDSLDLDMELRYLARDYYLVDSTALRVMEWVLLTRRPEDSERDLRSLWFSRMQGVLQRNGAV